MATLRGCQSETEWIDPGDACNRLFGALQDQGAFQGLLAGSDVDSMLERLILSARENPRPLHPCPPRRRGYLLTDWESAANGVR